MFRTEEDIEAWKIATRNVRRFLHAQPDINLPIPAKTESSAGAALSPIIQPIKSLNKPRYNALISLAEGEQGRMDKNSYTRLKKGLMPIDLTEDLHGLGVHEAHLRFYELINVAYEAGKRTILLITGKGFATPSKIRASVPSWINDPDLQPKILTYCKASSKHGGEGAYYIYLARRK